MILASSSSRSRRTASSSGSSSPKINPWSSGDGCGRSSHGDDDLASGLSRSQVADRLGHLAQRERPVDDRRDLPGFDQLLHDDQAVYGALVPRKGCSWLTNGATTISLTKRPRLPTRRWPEAPYWSCPMRTYVPSGLRARREA